MTFGLPVLKVGLNSLVYGYMPLHLSFVPKPLKKKKNIVVLNLAEDVGVKSVREFKRREIKKRKQYQKLIKFLDACHIYYHEIIISKLMII